MGKAGLKLSELSLGSWITFGDQISEETATKCISKALDSGVNFFDTAEAYASGKSETTMGNAIRKIGMSRESVVISSKVFWGGNGPNDTGLSRKHVFEACRNSLRRLQLDYLDLFFCHRPDPNTPIEETVRAMDDLVHQGKILYWGTSEWSAADIMSANSISREYDLTSPQMEQPQYNIIHRDRVECEYLPLFREMGLGATIWSPLSSGLLSGKYDNGVPAGSRFSRKDDDWLMDYMNSLVTPENSAKVKRLEPIARELGCTRAQLSIAWCLKNVNVSSVITGASQPEQVAENMKSVDIVPLLDSDIMEKIEGIFQNKPRDNSAQ